MPGPDPNETTSAPAARSINISGSENIIGGDVIGGDKIIQGDVNAATIGENARVGQVAVGTNITQIYNEAEQAYNVQGCENPYLGLSAFKYEDRAKYAGREKVIQETVAKITAPASPIPLLFITGASGSGKSSFAQAGLLPALETFYDGFTVKHAVMRPAGDPLAALNDALWRQLRVTETRQVFENLTGLDTPPNQINLLILDQFEEFFTQAQQPAREQFFAFLVTLPPFAQTHTHIIATMRADYLPELFNHSALYDIAKRGVDLRAMNVEELKQAIEQPLRASPYAQTKKFDPALVDKLAEDAAQDAAYLPLLQVTLEEIWRKGFLKLEAYTNLTDAIKQRADQVLEYCDFDDATPDEKRDPAEQAALLDLLLDLVDVSADDDIHRDVRKQRAKTDLTRNEIARTRLVDELARARLLSVQQEGKDTNQIEVDLIHETLLTNWTRLQSAIAERRSELRHRARFEQNLDEWLSQNRAEQYLLEGVRLAEAHELDAHGDVALRNEDAKAYLRASIAQAEAAQQAELERERQRAEALAQAKREADLRAEEQQAANKVLRQRNLFLAGTLVLILLAVVAAGFFLLQSIAYSQTALANAQLAEARAVTEAEALSKNATAQANAIAQSIAANQAKQTAQAESTRAFEQQKTAEQQARISNARRIAAQSVTLRDTRFDLALLLSAEAVSQDNNLEVRSNLLDTLASQPIVRFLHGNTSSTRDVKFIEGGKVLVSGNEDGSIRFWDVENGRVSGEPIAAHNSAIRAIAASPDGKTLASASEDHIVRLWDLKTRKPIGKSLQHEGQVNSIIWSSDSKWLASGSDDGYIRFWDAASGEQMGATLEHPGGVNSIALYSDDRLLASAGQVSSIRLWDVQTGTLKKELVGHDAAVVYVAVSHDNKILASAGEDGKIMLWDAKTGEPLGVPLEGHTDAVRTLAFTLDDKVLASAGSDRSIRFWDITTRQQIGAPLLGNIGAIRSIAFGPGDKILASGSEERAIRLWDTEGRRPEQAATKDSTVFGFALSPNEKMLATGNCSRMSSDGVICEAGEIGFTDSASGKQIHPSIQDQLGFVNSLAFSPNGMILASGSADSSIHLWDVSTSKLLGVWSEQNQGLGQSVAFRSDGKVLASAGWDQTIRLWDVSQQSPFGMQFSPSSGFIRSLALNSDSKIIAAGTCARDDSITGICSAGEIWLWNTETGEKLRGPLAGHTGAVVSVALSPDGKTLASGSEDQTIRLWDVESGKPIGKPFKGHDGAVRSLAFSLDGKTLSSASCQKIENTGGCLAADIRHWNVSIEEWHKLACSIANRNLNRQEWEAYVKSGTNAWEDYGNNPTCPDLPDELPITPTPTP